MPAAKRPVPGHRGYHLTNTLNAEFGVIGTAGSTIMARLPDGKLCSFKEVWTEHHADADGSYTTWVELEEY